MVADQPFELRGVPLLEALGREHLQAIARLGRRVEFGAGELIFQQGDPGDRLLIIVRGAVRVFVSGDSGAEATIALLTTGESLGELALLDGRPRSACARAAEATTAVAISGTEFRRWLEDHPTAMLAMLETMSGRLRNTNEELTDLVLLDLSERLARRLLSLNEPAPGVRIRITQAELAERLGVTREAVNKQLRSLERAGVLATSRGAVTVLDERGLRMAALR